MFNAIMNQILNTIAVIIVMVVIVYIIDMFRMEKKENTPTFYFLIMGLTFVVGLLLTKTY